MICSRVDSFRPSREEMTYCVANVSKLSCNSSALVAEEVASFSKFSNSSQVAPNASRKLSISEISNVKSVPSFT